jgi:hypothetical protein
VRRRTERETSGDIPKEKNSLGRQQITRGEWKNNNAMNLERKVAHR